MDKIEIRDDNDEPVMKIIDGKVYRLVNGEWVEEILLKNQKDNNEENGT